MTKQFYRIHKNKNLLKFASVWRYHTRKVFLNFQHVSAHLGPHQAVTHNTAESIKYLTLYAITYLTSKSFTKNPSYNTPINFLSIHEDPHALPRTCSIFMGAKKCFAGEAVENNKEREAFAVL